jgi:hypothetical protein
VAPAAAPAIALTIALACTPAWGQAQAPAQPAPQLPSIVLLDLSSEALIDSQAARALLEAEIPARVWRVYPRRKWTFLSQVEGGMTAEGVCVVTARVLLLPRVGTQRAVLWRPEKRATTFDARPGATAQQCRDIARQKLKEATASVVAMLVRS